MVSQFVVARTSRLGVVTAKMVATRQEDRYGGGIIHAFGEFPGLTRGLVQSHRPKVAGTFMVVVLAEVDAVVVIDGDVVNARGALAGLGIA